MLVRIKTKTGAIIMMNSENILTIRAIKKESSVRAMGWSQLEVSKKEALRLMDKLGGKCVTINGYEDGYRQALLDVAKDIEQFSVYGVKGQYINRRDVVKQVRKMAKEPWTKGEVEQAEKDGKKLFDTIFPVKLRGECVCQKKYKKGDTIKVDDEFIHHLTMQMISLINGQKLQEEMINKAILDKHPFLKDYDWAFGVPGSTIDILGKRTTNKLKE